MSRRRILEWIVPLAVMPLFLLLLLRGAAILNG